MSLVARAPRLTWLSAFVAAALCSGSLLLSAPPAAAQPQIPATFYGTASIDGRTPPADADVRAFIDGLDCTQLGPAARFVIDGGVGKYVVAVVHESQRAGCGKEGKSVTFTVAGQPAGQSGTWKASAQNLNLNTGSGTPAPLPTSTAAPPVAATNVGGGASGGATATASSSGGGSAPGATATLIGDGPARTDQGVTGGVRPLGTTTRAPVTSGGLPEAGGSNTLPIILLVLAGLGLAGGIAGGILVRRKR